MQHYKFKSIILNATSGFTQFYSNLQNNINNNFILRFFEGYIWNNNEMMYIWVNKN